MPPATPATRIAPAAAAEMPAAARSAEAPAAAAEMPAAAATSCKVVVWNMQRGISLETWLRLPALRDADVLLLCEVDHGMARSDNLNVAEALADGLGLHHVFAPEYRELTRGTAIERLRTLGRANRAGLHGNAILSRWPLSEARRVPLPTEFDWGQSYERRTGERIALVATAHAPGGPLVLVSTHLEAFTTPEGRARQMRCLLRALPESAPAIVGGDLNTVGVALTRRIGPKLGPREVRELLAACARNRSRLADPSAHEPLFEAAERAGFCFREANTHHGTWPAHPLVPGFARPRLDWVLVRGLEIEARATLPAPARPRRLGGLAPALSDHHGVSVKVRYARRAR